MNRYAHSLLLSTFVLSSSVSANEHDENDFLAPIPIILSTTHLSQPANEVPTATTVIDRETIIASGATEVVDLLRLVPGFQVSHALGNQFAVTYHGHSSTFPRNMQLLIDGRSAYSPLFSIIDWNHLGLTIEDIERIEVVRGSNTPIDGTNAFSGTINFITRQPFQDQGVYMAATEGSNETHRQVLRIAGSTGNIDQRLTLMHREDNGFDHVNDGRNLDQVSYRGSYFPTERNAIDIQLGYAEGPMGIGFDDTGSPPRTKETRSHYAFARWQHTLANGNEIYAQVYNNFLEWRDDEVSIGPLSTLLGVSSATVQAVTGNPDQSFAIGEFSGRAVRQDIEVRHTLQIDDGLQAIWGIGLRMDRFSSVSNLDRDDPVDNYSRRLFGHFAWHLAENLLVNAGAILENNDLSQTEVSPRLAFNYHLDSAQSLRFSVTRSARMPSILEARHLGTIRFDSGDLLDIRFDSQSGLRPEKITSYELGYLLQLPRQGLNLEAKLFHDQITDIITAPTVGNYPDPFFFNDQAAAVWMNGGHLDRSGLDLGLDYRLGPADRLILNYSYAAGEGQVIKKINTGIAVDRDDIQNSVPRHTISMLVSHDFSDTLLASLAWYRVSPMTWLGDGDPVEGYDRIDAHIRKTIPVSFGDLGIALTIQNLFDDPYHEATNSIETASKSNVFRRRYFVNLNLQI